jgi:hypothetical protein
MEENIIPTEGQIESGGARGAEEQALDDATFEPEAYVEQNGDYQQAEAIQENLVSVTENAAKGAEKVGASPLPISHEADQANVEVQSGKLGTDPLTGEEFGGKEGESEGESSGLTLSAKEEELAGRQLQVRGDLVQPKASDEGGGKDEATPSNLFGPQQANVDDLGPEHLTPDQLPEQAKGFAGEGAHGMIEKSAGPGAGLGVEHGLDHNMGPGKNMGPGTGTGTSGSDPERIGNQPGMPMPGGKGPGGLSGGYGPGQSGGGQSSSGGGAPVDIPGGSKGKPKQGGKKGGGKGGTEHDGFHDGNGPTGRWLTSKAMKDGNSGYVEEPDGKGTWVLGTDGNWYYQEHDDELAPAETTPPQSDPIDGDFGMPYTGSGHWGGEPDPEVVGGVDKESGHFTPMISIGGKSTGGSGGWGPDDLDDSGKFYGGIFASSGRPNNPDDPDYYTPNVLEEATKTAKSAK